jgi:hypothetical protein
MAPKINDFGKELLFKDIAENVAQLSSDLRQPDKFAQIFCEAAKTQKVIDSAIRDVIVNVLQKDTDTQQAIFSIVDKADRTYARLLMGRMGFVIWTIAIIFIEALIHKFFRV